VAAVAGQGRGEGQDQAEKKSYYEDKSHGPTNGKRIFTLWGGRVLVGRTGVMKGEKLALGGGKKGGIRPKTLFQIEKSNCSKVFFLAEEVEEVTLHGHFPEKVKEEYFGETKTDLSSGGSA